MENSNRVIKFRAWDKKNEGMLQNVAVQNNGKCAISQEDIFELMQFTGLHDKNGKEIYEGDIIRYGNELYLSNEVVEWKYGSWQCGGQSLYHYNEYVNEVIGNIYENPNLLEK